MSIKGTSPTAGHSSNLSLSLAENGRGYTYKKDPSRTPDSPGYVPLAERDPSTVDSGVLHPANAKAIATRKARVDRYCELRDEGMPKAEAAAEVQVLRTAAKKYEDEYQARKEAGDG